MSSTGAWQRYKNVRLQALLSSSFSLYLARFPSDLNHLFRTAGILSMAPATVSHLTIWMFPIAATLTAVATVRWLWFACPACDGTFMACGPKISGRQLLVNPLARNCTHCGLAKGTSVVASLPIVAELVPSLPESNLVPFEKILSERMATLATIRKQA